jgi:hypothetical protein
MKKRTVVEYALNMSKKPIAVANYRITPTLPKNLKKELPAPEQIRKLFDEQKIISNAPFRKRVR